MTTDQKIKSVVLRASTLGLDSFILAKVEGENFTAHFEKMKISDSMKVAIALFKQVIDMDIENAKDMPEEKKKLYVELVKDFNSLIISYNKKFENLK